MKPTQSATYTIPNGSTILLVRKVKYRGDKYCIAKIEIYTKSGILLDITKNAKLYYDKIQHWELVK